MLELPKHDHYVATSVWASSKESSSFHDHRDDSIDYGLMTRSSTSSRSKVDLASHSKEIFNLKPEEVTPSEIASFLIIHLGSDYEGIGEAVMAYELDGLTLCETEHKDMRAMADELGAHLQGSPQDILTLLFFLKAKLSKSNPQSSSNASSVTK
jgi:hypothetical protein